MRFWVIGVILLVGGAELYQWMRHFTLPLPMVIMAGVVLAIASNYDKHLPFRLSLNTSDMERDRVNPSSSSAYPDTQQLPISPELPRFQTTQSSRSISFEIKKPDGLGDQ
jgi:hypothetical protein